MEIITLTIPKMFYDSLVEAYKAVNVSFGSQVVHEDHVQYVNMTTVTVTVHVKDHQSAFSLGVHYQKQLLKL